MRISDWSSDVCSSDLRYLYSRAAPGREMFAVTLQMLKWGDKWSYGEGDEPLILTHEPCGQRLHSDLRCRGCGQTVHYRDCEPLAPRRPSSTADDRYDAGRLRPFVAV